MGPKEKLQYVLDNYKNAFIVVEKEEDVTALESLGFTRVYEVYQGVREVYSRAREIIGSMKGDEQAILLPNFDRHGRQLFVLLCHLFADAGKRIDPTPRGIIKKFGITYIKELKANSPKEQEPKVIK